MVGGGRSSSLYRLGHFLQIQICHLARMSREELFHLRQPDDRIRHERTEAGFPKSRFVTMGSRDMVS